MDVYNSIGISQAAQTAVQRIVPVPTHVVPNASIGSSNNVSVKIARVHYGAGKAANEEIVLSDAELGVMPYKPLTFAREVESAEWQQKIHMSGLTPSGKRPNGTYLYGSHGPTDLLNLTATLMALKCGEPVLNATTYPETSKERVT